MMDVECQLLADIVDRSGYQIIDIRPIDKRMGLHSAVKPKTIENCDRDLSRQHCTPARSGDTNV